MQESAYMKLDSKLDFKQSKRLVKILPPLNEQYFSEHGETLENETVLSRHNPWGWAWNKNIV